MLEVEYLKVEETERRDLGTSEVTPMSLVSLPFSLPSPPPQRGESGADKNSQEHALKTLGGPWEGRSTTI